MNYADKVAKKNYLMKIFGMIFVGIGFGLLLSGGTYIMFHRLAEYVAKWNDDVWILTFIRYRFAACWIGMAASCLGFLFQWRAEDSEAALQKTNRLVAYSR